MLVKVIALADDGQTFSEIAISPEHVVAIATTKPQYFDAACRIDLDTCQHFIVRGTLDEVVSAMLYGTSD